MVRISKIIPKEMDYFDLFDDLGKKAEQAAILFCSDLSIEKKAEDLKKIEHEADMIVHKVYDKLDSSRDLPLESQENIEALVHDIDDIIDLLEKSADRILRYGLVYEEIFLALGRLNREAIREIQKGLTLLRAYSKSNKHYQQIKKTYIRINDIESRGDRIHREFVSAVTDVSSLGEPHTTSEVWVHAKEMWYRLLRKEVAEKLERALDEAEHVANTFESLKKKNA